MTPITEQQKKTVFERLSKRAHQTVFNGLHTDLQSTVIELINRNQINGELEKWFDEGQATVIDQLSQWKKALDEERKKEELKKKQEEDQRIQKEKELMNNIVKLMLRMLMMEFMKNVFKLTSPTALTYEQTLEKLKEYNSTLQMKYLGPVFTAYNIISVEVQNRIHQIALENLYDKLFSLSVKMESGDSTQYIVIAQLAAIKYREDIFGFDVVDSDEKVAKVMKDKYDDVIRATAVTYADLSGTPVETVINILDNYAPTVLSQLKEAVL